MQRLHNWCSHVNQGVISITIEKKYKQLWWNIAVNFKLVEMFSVMTCKIIWRLVHHSHNGFMTSKFDWTGARLTHQWRACWTSQPKNNWVSSIQFFFLPVLLFYYLIWVFDKEKKMFLSFLNIHIPNMLFLKKSSLSCTSLLFQLLPGSITARSNISATLKRNIFIILRII